ncbi:MAG: hypothetical protein Q8L52_02640 [bacterium]|nr:hypothetical protein [bacterium]
MSKKFSSAIAMVLVIALIAPVAFLIAPQKTSAQALSVECAAGLIGGLASGIASFFGLASIPTGDAGNAATNALTAGSTIGACVYKSVVQPFLRSMVRNVLTAMTGTIIDFINGTKSNSRPGFVVNLSLHLQRVGDAIATPFINQFRMVTNPAFAGAIASSLLTKYALGTSVGGFLAQSRSTFPSASNPTAFVAGNFSQGGIPAWFALTTKNENNPYLLAPAAQDQLKSLVAQAQTNRRQDLVQSKGFLSWCDNGSGTTGSTGISPGASCIKDGKEGNVKTPGSVIQGYAQQALGSEMAQYINPTDIDMALYNIASALINQTTKEFTGAIAGITSGLTDASKVSSDRPASITTAMKNTAANNAAALEAANAAANTAISQATDYTNAWNTISSAASNAFVNVTALRNNTAAACVSLSITVNTTLGVINGVVAQATQAATDSSAKNTFARTVQTEATSGSSATLTANIQRLKAMIPVEAAVTDAQSKAATTGGATASPVGSLSVTGGTLVDQMTLISMNAQTLHASNCATMP